MGGGKYGLVSERLSRRRLERTYVEERRARRKIYLRRSTGRPLYDSSLLVSSGESER